MNTHINKRKIKKPVYREKISFDKADLLINMAGVSMPTDIMPKMDQEIDIFKSMEQFGWMGAANNNNNFYPGLNVPKDVMPKPEDFVDIPFRLITATIVGAWSWKATDFSNVSVLKNSSSKLLEKPVYTEHDTELANWVGLVKGVKWTEATTMDDGTLVPAGIDGILSLDAKTNPKIVRGVLIGSIFSNSVTVVFDWEPSHTFDNPNDFYDKMGTLDKDGTMVRRVVTAIHDYYETSLVWLGADPFAKLIGKDGKLKNIDTSSVAYDKVTDTVKKVWEDEKKYEIKFGFDEKILALSKRTTAKPLNKDDMNPKMLAQLAVMLGMKAEDITANPDAAVEALSKLKTVSVADDTTNTANAALAAAVTPVMTAFATEAKLGAITDVADFFKTKVSLIAVDALTTLKADAGKVVGLEKDKTDLTAEVVTLKKDKSELAADAKTGKEFVQLKRDETVRLYKLHAGTKADEAVIKLINNAPSDALEGLLKQYAKDATGKFSGSCKKCGSDEFEFRSSISSGKGDEDNDDGESKGSSFADIHNKFDQSSLHLGTIKDKKEDKK